MCCNYKVNECYSICVFRYLDAIKMIFQNREGIKMKKNPLIAVNELGQSIWMDFISRRMIFSGQLKELIETDGITGITSNPSIFEKAIAEGHDYDAAIMDLVHAGKSADEIYQTLTVTDIQSAADLLRPVYLKTLGADGYVSLEVSPRLAYDTAGTIEEARRLWRLVDRPNVMIKVPGTKEGIPAIKQLIAEGININVTLLFGLPRYQEVAEAFVAGLEDRLSKGRPIGDIFSVASFFLSRIDVLLDPMLDQIGRKDRITGETAKRLKGQTALSSAKIAYQVYKNIFIGDRFNKLARIGGRPQRLLWASTSTKNPEYPDTKYVEPLIGPETINTLPIETIDAYRDHGEPHTTLSNDVHESRTRLELLKEVGIDLDKITQQLENEGVEKFTKAFDQLMNALKQKQEDLRSHTVRRQVHAAN